LAVNGIDPDRVEGGGLAASPFLITGEVTGKKEGGTMAGRQEGNP